MAFALKHRKSIGSQLARIVAKELRAAVDEVAHASSGGKAIHETRKRVKKIRSVLHLLRKELGDSYARLNDQVRSAARQLSAIRDADVLVATMEKVRRHHGRLVTPEIFRVADATLKKRRSEAYARFGPRRIALVRTRLVHSRRVMPDRIRAVANNRTMRDGVRRGYRRARKAMEEAIAARAEDVRFHTWRRRVKDHWYQMRLVEGVDGTARRRVRQLKQLQDWLGDDHNLVVLRSVILSEPHRFGDARAVAVILGCIDEHQAALRRRAVKRGHQLFSSKPQAFRKQISRWLA